MSHNMPVNEQLREQQLEANPHGSFEDLVRILGSSAGNCNVATCEINLLQMPDLKEEEEQRQPNPLVEMNIHSMLREKTAVALSGDFDTAHDYAAAVFNSKGSVTFLLNNSEAAQQVAWRLRGEWDGLNAVTLEEYDEAGLVTVADLEGAEFCCEGQACFLPMSGKSDAISRMMVQAFG